jgi:hypothetical protein
MIRFVDTRQQGLDHRFSFWDTVRSTYVSFSDDVAWDTWADFVDSYNLDAATSHGTATDVFKRLDRFKGLCPQWVFERGDGNSMEEIAESRQKGRFIHALQALRDCYKRMEDKKISEGESAAREQLVNLCSRIHGNYGH